MFTGVHWRCWGTPLFVTDLSRRCQGRRLAPVIVVGQPSFTIDEALAGPMGSRTVVGSSERIIEAVGEYAALGFDEAIIPDFALGATTEQRFNAYEQIAAEVVPHCS